MKSCENEKWIDYFNTWNTIGLKSLIEYFNILGCILTFNWRLSASAKKSSSCSVAVVMKDQTKIMESHSGIAFLRSLDWVLAGKDKSSCWLVAKLINLCLEICFIELTISSLFCITYLLQLSMVLRN